jgi:hypothetical protein
MLGRARCRPSKWQLATLLLEGAAAGWERAHTLNGAARISAGAFLKVLSYVKLNCAAFAGYK